MAKAMKEISSGAQKWEGEKWYSELPLSRFIKININHGGIGAKSAENMFCKCLEISSVQVSKNWFLREKLNIFSIRPP